MTHYSVLDVTPTSQDWIEDYLPTANRLIAKHGGTYLARTGAHERLEGDGSDDTDGTLRIIIEWPSAEAAKAFMTDPEYQPHLKARHDGSVSNHYLIAGKDDLA